MKKLIAVLTALLALALFTACEKEPVEAVGSGTAGEIISNSNGLSHGGVLSDTESWESVVGLD